MTVYQLINQYLSIDSILLLFIIIFVFVLIREVLTGLSKSHFKYVFIFLIFLISILSLLDRMILLSIIFFIFGLVIIIGLHFVNGDKNDKE